MATGRTTIVILLLCTLGACGKPQQDAAKSESAPSLSAQLPAAGQGTGPTMGDHASTLDKGLFQPVDMATLTARAKQGDTGAQYDLGLRYAEGNGAEKESVRCRRLVPRRC